MTGRQEFLYLLGSSHPDIFRNTLPHTWVFLHIHFPTPFLYTSFPFIVYLFPFLHCLVLFPVCFTRTPLCSLSLSFIFLRLFLGNLGVCFFFGIHAWVVFVLYPTSYMAGFGFWAGGDDCWCASFFFDLPFYIRPFFSLFLAFLRQN